MAIPADRYKLLPLRGSKVNLDAGIGDILDGEICYAIDEDQYYQKEGSTLVAVGATKAQGMLAEVAVQPGDDVSTLTNDAGYITLAEVPPGGVTSVNTQVGDVVLDFSDVGAASAAQGATADSSLQPTDIGSTVQAYDANIVSDASYVRTDENFTTADQEKLGGIEVGAEVNPVNVSELVNDSGYITLAEVPPGGVTSVNEQTGAVVLDASDVGALPITGGTVGGDLSVTGAISPVVYDFTLIPELPGLAEDADMLLVNRGLFSYRTTWANLRASVPLPTFGPVLVSVTLSASASNTNRFTSALYDVTLALDPEGQPVSTKLLRAEVRGQLSTTGVTSEIIGISANTFTLASSTASLTNGGFVAGDIIRQDNSPVTPVSSAITNVAGNVLTLTDDTDLDKFSISDVVQEVDRLYSASVVGTNVSAVDAEVVFDGDTNVSLQAPTSGITWTTPEDGIAYTTARIFVIDIYSCDPSIVLDDVCRYVPTHTACMGLPLCPGVATDPVQGPSASQSTYRCSYVSSTGSGTLGAGTFSSTGQWLTIPGGPGVLDSVSWISGGSPSWGIAVAAIEIDGVILLDEYIDTYRVTAIDEAAPSITTDGGNWSGTDGSGDPAGETFVTTPQKDITATVVATNPSIPSITVTDVVGPWSANTGNFAVNSTTNPFLVTPETSAIADIGAGGNDYTATSTYVVSGAQGDEDPDGHYKCWDGDLATAWQFYGTVDTTDPWAPTTVTLATPIPYTSSVRVYLPAYPSSNRQVQCNGNPYINVGTDAGWVVLDSGSAALYSVQISYQGSGPGDAFGQSFPAAIEVDGVILTDTSTTILTFTDDTDLEQFVAGDSIYASASYDPTSSTIATVTSESIPYWDAGMSVAWTGSNTNLSPQGSTTGVIPELLPSTGVVYWEVEVKVFQEVRQLGLCFSSVPSSSYDDNTSTIYFDQASGQAIMLCKNADGSTAAGPGGDHGSAIVQISDPTTHAAGVPFGIGDVLGFAFDGDSGSLWLSLNGEWLIGNNALTAYPDATPDPIAGTFAMWSGIDMAQSVYFCSGYNSQLQVENRLTPLYPPTGDVDLTLTDSSELENFRVGDDVQYGTAYSSGIDGLGLSDEDKHRAFDGSVTTSLTAAGGTTVTWTPPGGAIAYNTARVFVIQDYPCTPYDEWLAGGGSEVCEYNPAHAFCKTYTACPGQTGGPDASQTSFRCGYSSSNGNGLFDVSTATGSWQAIPGGPGILTELSWNSDVAGSWSLSVAAVEINNLIVADEDPFVITAIDPSLLSVSVSGGAWSGANGSGDPAGQSFIAGPTIPPATGTVASVDLAANMIEIESPDGRWCTTTTATADQKEAVISTLYCELDSSGNVIDLVSTDPGYTEQTSTDAAQFLQFPAQFASGFFYPDEVLPAGTSLKVFAKAVNTEGEDEAASNTLFPS